MTHLLFDSSLSSNLPSLPQGYSFRPLSRDDSRNGHLETLQALAFIGDITPEQWTTQFDYMKSCHSTYFILVIKFEGKVIGTGTLVAERKFLFELGIQGHIEDIAVSKSHQKQGLGLALLHGLNSIAKQIGCYKTILDCSGKNVAFYQKCGFDQAGHEMQYYIDERAREHHV